MCEFFLLKSSILYLCIEINYEVNNLIKKILDSLKNNALNNI